MKKRHWERISDVTKHPIDIESDELKLRNIMEAPLLKYKVTTTKPIILYNKILLLN